MAVRRHSAPTSSSLAAESGKDEGGSFLVSPGLGLMIWTLALFGVTMCVLSKFAFPRISEALDKRANAIATNIEASERQRQEADELLEEYRQRLKEAREQADDIVARARKAAETAIAEATEDGKAKREELVAAARRDIEAETRRSLEQIRKEVADLTVIATEKVTRKSLDDEDQKRLVEEALNEVDFTRPRRRRQREERSCVEEIARVYAEALFDVAKEKDKLDQVREELGAVRRRPRRRPRAAGLLLQPLLLLGREAGGDREGGHRRRPRVRQLPRAADREAPDAGDLPHPAPVRGPLEAGEPQARRDRDQRGRARPRGRRARSAPRSRSRPASTVELSSRVDDAILGGIVLQVGNMVLDASIRNRLEKLRKSVAAGGVRRHPRTRWKSSQTRSPASCAQRIEGMEAGSADLSEVGTVLSVADGIARIHGLDNCMALEMLELPHDVTGLALNLEEDNVGAVLFGEWDKIVEGDTVKRTGHLLRIPVGEELLGRLVDPLGRPLDDKGDINTSETRPAEFKAPGRRPAPAGRRSRCRPA